LFREKSNPGAGQIELSLQPAHRRRGSAMDISSATLKNGVTMPRLGYGVSLTPPEETIAVVSEALRAGYRLIDTTAVYGNERGREGDP